MYKVDNAVIMAAGTSSRFAPLSYERPKALISVKGEVLIERQIRQLQEAGISEIYIVTGYRNNDFEYLKEKCNVKIRHNDLYNVRNNHSSIYKVRDIIRNTYICSADNYFETNPFTNEVEEAYYSALYANGDTKEWCLETDTNGYITDVKIGGSNAWYMLGHVFWDEEFSRKFLDILDREFPMEETKDKLWEDIYIEHINELKMKIHKYDKNQIFEFDTLDELREFDVSYVNNTRSYIIGQISKELKVLESDLTNFKCLKSDGNEAIGFEFMCNSIEYTYDYNKKKLEVKG